MPEESNVDIAELEKQYAELGELIVKAGGKVKYPDSDDAKLKAKKSEPKIERVKLDKAKKPIIDDEEDMTDDGADEDSEDVSNPGKTKKAAVKEEPVEKKEEPVAKKEIKPVDDETLVYKNETIKKSVVGEAQFAIIKALTADVMKSADDIAKAQDDALTAKLEKRADDEYPDVPGTTSERASMLKAIAKLDEPIRKSFEAVFTQSQKLAKAAFETLGTKAGDSEDIKKARGDFETKVSEVAKRDGTNRSAAMTKARQENPELFKAYQESLN